MIFFLLIAAPCPAPAAGDDWSLIKKDKDKKKDAAKADKKKKAGGKKSKKTKKKKDDAGQEPGETLQGSKYSGTFAKLKKDPTDDYLASGFVEAVQVKEEDLGQILAELEGGISDDPGSRLALAHLYILAGEGARAEALLSALESESPGKAATAFLSALAAESQDKADEAKTLLQEALGRCKGYADEIIKTRIQGWLLTAALDTGDLKLASQAFIQTVKTSGQLEDSFEKILTGFIAADKREEAEAFLLGVIDAFPWSKYEKHYLYSTLAEHLYGSGKYEQAMEASAKALAQYIPSTGECELAVDHYVNSALQLDRVAEAVTALLGKKAPPCVYVRCASHLDDYEGPKEALAVLEKGLKKHPGNEALIVGYAKMLSKLGKGEEATAFLKKKIKKLTSPEIIGEFADLVLELEGPSKAGAELEKLSKGSKEIWVHMALEEFFDSIGDPGAAKKENELLTSLDPSNPEHFIRLGERIYTEGKLNEAKAIWNKIVKLYGDEFQGKLMLADILFDHSLNTEAGALYNELLKQDEANIEVVKKLAIFSQSTGKIKEAESWWQVVLNADESDFHLKYEAALRLIQLWKLMGQLKKKESEVKLLVERNVDDPLPKIMLAEILFELDDLERCEEVVSDLFATGLKEAETFSATMAIWEKVAKGKSKPGEFVDKIEKYMDLYPDKKTELLLKMAQYSVKSSDYALAKKCLKEALGIKPNDVALHDKASTLYMTMGDYDSAIASLKIIVAADPYNHARLVDLAEALINAGDESESIKLLEKVVEGSGDVFLLDRAFSLLFAVKHGDASPTSLEPYIHKLYKKSKNERLLEELIEIYAIMTEEGMAQPGGPEPGGQKPDGPEPDGPASGCKAGEGSEGPCGWQLRAGSLAASVIVDGPDALRLQAARIFQVVGTAVLKESLLRKAADSVRPDAQIFALAASSAVALPGVQAAGIYSPFMESTNKDVKAMAVIAAALDGLKEAGESSLKLFADPDPNMRAAGILAAGVLLTRSPSEDLVEKIKDEIIRALHERQFSLTYGAAVVALGQAGGDDAYDSLSGIYERYSEGKEGGGGALNTSTRVLLKLILMAMAEGKMEDDRVIPFLVAETWSQHADIREAAAYALHAVSCRRTTGTCASMVKASIPVTVSMSAGKVQLFDLFQDWTRVPDYAFGKDQIQFLKKHLRSTVKGEIDAALSKTPVGAAQFAKLERLLAALATKQGDVQWEPLTEHVKAKDQEAVRKILLAVYKEMAPSLEEALEACYGSDLNTAGSILKPLILFISRIVTDHVPEVVLKAAREHPDEPEGLAAIEALGRYDQPEAIDALRAAAESSSWVTRIAVVESLQEIGTAEACALLSLMAEKDKASPVKELAGEAAASCGTN